MYDYYIYSIWRYLKCTLLASGHNSFLDTVTYIFISDLRKNKLKPQIVDGNKTYASYYIHKLRIQFLKRIEITIYFKLYHITRVNKSY